MLCSPGCSVLSVSVATASGSGIRLALMRARVDVSSSSQTTLPRKRRGGIRKFSSSTGDLMTDKLNNLLTGRVVDPLDVRWGILLKIPKDVLRAHIVHARHINRLHAQPGDGWAPPKKTMTTGSAPNVKDVGGRVGGGVNNRFIPFFIASLSKKTFLWTTLSSLWKWKRLARFSFLSIASWWKHSTSLLICWRCNNLYQDLK